MSLRNDAWPRDGECYPVWAHARTPPPRSLDRGCPGNAKSLQDSMNNQRERVVFDSKLLLLLENCFFFEWILAYGKFENRLFRIVIRLQIRLL